MMSVLEWFIYPLFPTIMHVFRVVHLYTLSHYDVCTRVASLLCNRPTMMSVLE